MWVNWKKQSVYKWTCTVQTLVAQSSTVDWCRKKRKCSKAKLHCLLGKVEEGSSVWPTEWQALLVALLIEPSFAWASNMQNFRQDNHVLSLSKARGGHVTYFLPMRHEQNSTEGSGKIHLLCFPFISALKMYMMAGARAAIFPPQGEGQRITIMSALMLSY